MATQFLWESPGELYLELRGELRVFQKEKEGSLFQKPQGEKMGNVSCLQGTAGPTP